MSFHVAQFPVTLFSATSFPMTTFPVTSFPVTKFPDYFFSPASYFCVSADYTARAVVRSRERDGGNMHEKDK